MPQELLRLLRKGNAFPNALNARQGSSGRKYPRCKLGLKGHCYSKQFSLVLISSLMRGAPCALELEFLQTFQKSTVTPLAWPTKKSLLRLVEASSVSWKLQMLNDSDDFFFSCGVWGRAEKYTLNLKLSIKQICLYILTGLQTWEKAQPFYLQH